MNHEIKAGQRNQPRRLGVVSFLNSKPLIAGLEDQPDVRLRLEVPSLLPSLLDAGEVDAALVPVVDIAERAGRWKIVSDACIGCDGETLTVRVFSRVPAKQIETLHVDGDSHTSIALARTLWLELFDRKLKIVPFPGGRETPDVQAVLLIGDKVINHNLIELDLQTDLGALWKSATGLPFVFAAWAVPSELDSRDLADLLNAARDCGVQQADNIAQTFAPGMGWPVELAKRYLTQRLNFTLTDRHKQGMALFMQYCKKHGIVAHSFDPVLT
jgi:chorismate dehydratase